MFQECLKLKIRFGAGAPISKSFQAFQQFQVFQEQQHVSRAFQETARDSKSFKSGIKSMFQE